MSSIVDHILLSSRVEAGRAKISCEDVSAEPILRERVDALQTASGRDVSIEVQPGLPSMVADRSALTTVLDHLLDNAVKYSPDGGAVTLAATYDDSLVQLSVSDSGIGMDSEQAARCFEKFWQAESSDVRRFGGTGIGLYIVRSLVEAMGGEIGVVSKIGSGTAFRVSLDRATASSVDESEERLPGELVR